VPDYQAKSSTYPLSSKKSEIDQFGCFQFGDSFFNAGVGSVSVQTNN
jgi:hypothetical protein